MLRAWYQELLQKAKLQGVVLRTSTLFDEYFKSDGIDSFGNPNNDPSCLPYFDGDYIPGEIESIIRSLNQDDVKELLAYRSIPGQIGQDKIMMILGQRLSNMRENFIVVQLRSRRFVAAVERGENVSDWIADDDEENLRNKRAKINGKDSSILFPPSKDDIHRGLKIDSGGSSLIKIDSGGSSLINEKNDEAVQRQEGLSTKDVETKGKSLTEDSPSAGDTFCNDPFRRGSEGSGHFDLLNSRTAFDTDPLAVKPTLSQTSGGTHSTGRHGHDGSISNEDSFSDHPLPIGRTHSADAGFSDYGEEFGPKINEVDIQPEDVRDLNDPGYSPERVKILSKWAFDDMEPVLARHLGKTNGKVVGSTSDEDEPCDTEMFESRQQFLNYCQKNHFQFDELRRAKHSTMMILFQLHNPCNNCSSFDLCDELFQPVTSGLLAKRDARFEHDKNHTFTSVDLEAPTDLSIEERTRTIKVHLELLSHAASCHGPPKCSLNNCQRMKELLGHVSKCDAIVKNGCKVCSRLLPLISMHARSCTNPRGQCPIPFCDRIRERNERVRRQQQLMDDRRRQAQNDLYRVGCISGQEEPKPCGEVL
jgi:E1A/CREB-binding protein